MNDVIIRPLVRGDLDRVAYLVEANAMFPAEMLGAMTTGHFGLEADTQRWIVAVGERVEGAAYYVPEPFTEGAWNVLMICVDPTAHGRGIGTALMRHIEAELRARGARILLVETSGTPAFARTRGFYELLGYDREARIRDYYMTGDDKIIFRTALI